MLAPSAWMLSAFAVAVVTLVHVLEPRFPFLKRIPHAAALSFAGGVSVSFVFLEVLPLLAQAQARLDPGFRGVAGSFDQHVYVLALVGLVLFFGLEGWAVRSRGGRRERGRESATRVFFVHVAAFFFYNAIIGYLLRPRAAEEIGGFVLFAIALFFHVAVIDYGLTDHHPRLHARFGRWLLASAAFAGWLVGVFIEARPIVVELALSFLAGGIVLNALKEEVPGARESRFGAFVVGVVAFALLLAVV